MIDPAVVLLVSFCAAVLFATAAVHKLTALDRFKAALVAYDILPAHTATAASYLLPVCEMLVAISLLVESLRAPAIAIAACLLAGYAVAIAVNLRRGRRYIDCGCTGFGERRPIAAWMVVRNLALALVLVLLAAIPWATRAFSWIDVVTLVGGVTVVGFLYRAAEVLFGRLPHIMQSGASRT